MPIFTKIITAKAAINQRSGVPCKPSTIIAKIKTVAPAKPAARPACIRCALSRSSPFISIKTKIEKITNKIKRVPKMIDVEVLLPQT